MICKEQLRKILDKGSQGHRDGETKVCKLSSMLSGNIFRFVTAYSCRLYWTVMPGYGTGIYIPCTFMCS
jgi:hypothetical protein